MELVKARAVPDAGNRMAFVDNIRWVVIVMVVLIHASVTYSGIGSWFYKEPVRLDMVSMLTFAFYESLSQAFFMGFLFFLAGTFVPGAYDRKGFGRFVLDRLIRLGAPTLVFMLVLDPLTRLIIRLFSGQRPSLAAFFQGWLDVIRSGHVVDRTGPLWFALALLVFSIVYALVRLVAGRPARAGGQTEVRALTPRAIHLAAVGLVVLIGSGSFLVRLVQPIGTSWFNMQLCFFTQYVVLFIAGLWAGRSGFLKALPAAVGTVWLRLALAVGVPAWFLLLGLGGAGIGGFDVFSGGLRWQAAGYAFWEAFFAVSMSLGLVTLFREKVNGPSRIAGFLSRTSFGVYALHAPLLVTASLLLRGWAAYPLAKAFAAAAIGFALSLAAAAIVRSMPGLRRIFS
ncbi:MAG TPA: acyltransferase family protein [Spirochaetia bacterium]|nr:acyltransferase family protein [Spirochaetia bacterium]